ncbi:hypothetical protein ABK040_009935 [Willaertia magna]
MLDENEPSKITLQNFTKEQLIKKLQKIRKLYIFLTDFLCGSTLNYFYFKILTFIFPNKYKLQTFKFFTKNLNSTQEITSYYFTKTGNKKTLIYIHGGGYFFNNAFVTCGPFLEKFLEKNLNLFLIEYKHFPEHSIKESLINILEQLNFIVNDLKLENLVLAGDSAGGNLLLRTIKKLYSLQKNTLQQNLENNLQQNLQQNLENDGELEIPIKIKEGLQNKFHFFTKIILLSPWLDLTFNEPSVTKKENLNELILTYNFFTTCRFLNVPFHTSELQENLKFSPLYWEDYNFLKNCKVYLNFGDKERLSDEIVKFWEKLKMVNGLELTVDVGKEMFHDYWTFYRFTKFGRECLDNFIKFALKD